MLSTGLLPPYMVNSVGAALLCVRPLPLIDGVGKFNDGGHPGHVFGFDQYREYVLGCKCCWSIFVIIIIIIIIIM